MKLFSLAAPSTILESPQKTHIHTRFIRMQIFSAQNVGKAPISRKKSTGPHLGHLCQCHKITHAVLKKTTRSPRNSCKKKTTKHSKSPRNRVNPRNTTGCAAGCAAACTAACVARGARISRHRRGSSGWRCSLVRNQVCEAVVGLLVGGLCGGVRAKRVELTQDGLERRSFSCACKDQGSRSEGDTGEDHLLTARQVEPEAVLAAAPLGLGVSYGRTLQ